MLFEDLDLATSWGAVIDAEPGLTSPLPDDALDGALEAIADFVDIKSPFTLGHSRGVAELAARAAAAMGLGSATATHVRRAGLLHDLGRPASPTRCGTRPVNCRRRSSSGYGCTRT